MNVTFLGLIAGVLTTFSLVPQVLQIIKTKHTKDLSSKTYIILGIGLLLWTIYGFFIKDITVILANGITLLLVLTIILFKKKYG